MSRYEARWPLNGENKGFPYRLRLIKTQNEKGPVTLNSREDLEGIHWYGSR